MIQGQIVWYCEVRISELSSDLVDSFETKDCDKVQYTSKNQIIDISKVQKGEDQKSDEREKDGDLTVGKREGNKGYLSTLIVPASPRVQDILGSFLHSQMMKRIMWILQQSMISIVLTKPRRR